MLNRGELFRKLNLGKTTRLPSVPDQDYTFVGPVDKEDLAKVTGLNVNDITEADVLVAQQNAKENEALNEAGMAIGRDSYKKGKREAELPGQKRMAGVVLAALAGGAGINEIIEYLQGPTIEETEYYR